MGENEGRMASFKIDSKHVYRLKFDLAGFSSTYVWPFAIKKLFLAPMVVLKIEKGSGSVRFVYFE